MSVKYEKISREQIDACVAREGIKEDERIDPADGLPHCIRCGERTAIVKWHPARKHELMLAGCMCKCKRDEEQRYREEDAKRERRLMIERSRLSRLQDPSLPNYRFENGHCDTEEMRKAMIYAKEFKDEPGKYPKGLVFFGPVGTGKTFAAGCIANALVVRGVPVLMTSFLKLLELPFEDKDGGLAEEIQKMQNYSLVILDDFGAERETEFVLEKILYVIDERCKSGKPFILTTNYTPEEMKNKKDLKHQRIYNRIMGHCGFVVCNTKNYRGEEAKTAHAELRELFAEPERHLQFDAPFTEPENNGNAVIEKTEGGGI